MDNHQTNLKEQILKQIKSGSIKAKPKFHFVLRTLFLLSGLLLAGLLLLYLLSFVFFILRSNGLWQAPVFGLRGWGLLFGSLPWMILLLIGLFVLVMELLVKHFSFAYRRPLLYSVLGIVVFLGLSGFVVAQTPLHQSLWELAETEEGLPLAGPLYGILRSSDPDDFHRGTVLSTSTNGFDMLNLSEEVLLIEITPTTRLPFALDIAPGDMVMVIGERQNNQVKAFGVREFVKPLPLPKKMNNNPTGRGRHK